MKNKINPAIKKLILWKLNTEVPSNFRLSIGNKGTFTKNELMKSIEKEDDVGRTYINMEMKFIKALVSGELTDTLAQ